MRTMAPLVCPGKGAGTIGWPEHTSAHWHCTTQPQRQRGIPYRAALQLLPAFLEGHWRKGGDTRAREEWASGAAPLVAPAPAFSSVAEAIYQQKRKPLHTRLLRHRKHEGNLRRVRNFQQHHCCSFESPDSTCSFPPHPVKFKTLSHSSSFGNLSLARKSQTKTQQLFNMWQWFKPLFYRLLWCYSPEATDPKPAERCLCTRPWLGKPHPRSIVALQFCTISFPSGHLKWRVTQGCINIPRAIHTSAQAWFFSGVA